MQAANNNLFKRLKKRKMKDSILNSITWIVSSFGFIVLITLFILFLQKVAKLYLLIYFLVIIQKQLIL